MPTERDPLIKNGVNEDRYYMGVEKRSLMNTPETGLSTVEAARRLQTFGPNELEDNEKSALRKLLEQFWGPMPIMIWIAIIVELITRDIPDFCVLLFLQLLNGTVGWYEEVKAGNAVAALKAQLKPAAQVIRDGVHQTINASLLVPGDRVTLSAGAAVPADCDICEGKPIQIDQAALTGESFPVTMGPGDNAKMGSTVVRGEIEAIVSATGSQTFFGKTASLISSVDELSHFQKILIQITMFLMALSFLLVGTCLGYLLYNGEAFLEAIAFCVVLLVASIPIAMQVVCTSTMALGSRKLAEEKVIVTQLQAIETLSGMNLLCSDKTGTLTRNKMELQDDMPIFAPGVSREDVLVTAALAAKWKEPPKDALDTLVLNAIDLRPLDKYVLTDHMPFDPSVKRTESTIRSPDGKVFKTSKGAPQIILALAHNVDEIRESVEAKVLDLARRGIRSLAVAKTDESVNGGWIFMGIMTFLDPPRHDTKETIRLAHENGIGVKMITGDQSAIAVETCRMLGMGTTILGTDVLPSYGGDDGISMTLGHDYGAIVESADGFAQVFPEHKFLIVEILRQRGWICGMTGDGVNDAPALKKADVGIAVEGSTDAARAAADIVLTKPGLSVIINAITLSRKIFQRMKNYVTYRIACTIQLLLFFFISVLLFHPDSCQFPHFNPMEGICPNVDPQDAIERVAPYFKLPVIALVLITILNDGTIISIAYDNVVPSKLPESWDLPHIYWVASSLGLSAVASSLVLLYWGLDSWSPSGVLQYYGLGNLTYDEVMMMMYLKISLSDFFTVFAARTKWWFFTRLPGKLLFLAFCFATAVSTVLSIYWPFKEMHSIRAELALFVWIYCIIWFIIQDIIKVFVTYLMEQVYYGNVYIRKHDSKKMARHEAHRQNRIRMGSTFVSSDSLIRDSFVAGRAVSGSFVGGGAGVSSTMSLNQAMERINRLESELKTLRKVIQTASASTN